jgi:hypothetical protein
MGLSPELRRTALSGLPPDILEPLARNVGDTVKVSLSGHELRDLVAASFESLGSDNAARAALLGTIDTYGYAQNKGLKQLAYLLNSDMLDSEISDGSTVRDHFIASLGEHEVKSLLMFTPPPKQQGSGNVYFLGGAEQYMEVHNLISEPTKEALIKNRDDRENAARVASEQYALNNPKKVLRENEARQRYSQRGEFDYYSDKVVKNMLGGGGLLGATHPFLSASIDTWMGNQR